MTITAYGKTYEVRLIKNKYYNGNLAISVDYYDIDFHAWMPFATLTVNLDFEYLENDEAYIDTNNCEWAEEFIRENELGTLTDDVARSGFCVYPKYKFDLTKF